MKRGLFLVTALGLAASLDGQQAPPRTVNTVQLAENLFELTTYSTPIGTKMLALVGPEGTLLVDTGEAETARAELEALGRLSASSVRYVVNTHLHDDHTGGNPVLGASAIVIAHDNLRRRLTTGAGMLFPRPKESVPSITFDRAMTLFINGEEVRLLHLPPGHTDGDVVVHFVHSGVVAVGDLIFADKYPFIAFAHGGNVQGFLDDLETMASTFPAGTRFVAAHGPIYTAAQVRAYRSELLAMRDRVHQDLAAGKTAAQLKTAKALEPWASWGDSYITADRFIDTLVTAETPPVGAGKASVLDAMVPAALNGADGEAVVRLYRKLKAEQPSSFNFAESEINLLGYGLLRQQRFADAIAVFRLNVEEHLASANVYDSLAEAYVAAGQKDLAIANYKRSLELDPGNANAARMIERLQKPESPAP